MTRGLNAGIKKYVEFYNLDVRREIPVHIEVPKYVNCVGDALRTFYESDKVIESGDHRNKKNSYVHDHSSGVKIYKLHGEGVETKVPAWIQNEDTLVELGKSLGFEYRNLDGKKIGADASQPFPRLCCTPSGKLLLVIRGSRILAMFWGGSLNVTARGIVG